MVQEPSTGAKRQDEERRYSRSISQLKAYSKCGELFNLERMHRGVIPRRPAAWTILGLSLHETVMEWEKSSRAIDVDEYFDVCYDSIVHQEEARQPDYKYWIVPPRTASVKKSIQNYKERGFQQLDKYVTRFEEAPWEISHMEEEFEIDLEGVVVKGGVDRILYFPGTDEYLLEDLKTGSPEDEEDKRQLAFYAFIARELWNIPVKIGRFWYTKVDRPSETKNLEKFDKIFWTKTFKKLDEGISRGIFLPSPGKQCGLCSVKPWCSSQGWLEIGEKL